MNSEKQRITGIPGASLTSLGKSARAVSLLMLVYWALYVLVAPVTNFDSMSYNLARLELAWRGGLFGNNLWTSTYQVCWPWTFDATHLPFLKLGFATALPSFLCLCGTCYVVHRMLCKQLGVDAAWTGVLCLLSLSSVVQQGTSTKNDIPLLFCGAVWVYARFRYRSEKRVVHLGWLCLALGFMAGSKTSGLLIGAILGLFSLIELRATPRRALGFVGGCILSLLLFASLETYFESYQQFDHPLGPPSLSERYSNNDGLRGTLANMSRYAAGSIYVGPTNTGFGRSTATAIADAERSLLSVTHLREAGLGYKHSDRDLAYLNLGFEEFCGYGPIGSFAMAALFLALLWWKPRETWWQLAVMGLCGLALTSWMIGYRQWNSRYLLPWYSLGAVTCVLLLWRAGKTHYSKVLQWGFVVLAAANAVATPFLSFNRRPVDLITAVRDREQLACSNYPVAARMLESLRREKALTPDKQVYLVVNQESPLLPFLMDPVLQVSAMLPSEFHRQLSLGLIHEGDLVAEDYPIAAPALEVIEEVTAPSVYSLGKESFVRHIYRVRSTGASVSGDQKTQTRDHP